MGLEGLVTVEKIRAAINASLSGLSNSNATITITKNDGTTSTITINNVANATTATKLGSSTVGSGVKAIYLNEGKATASDSTVGDRVTPVYLNNGTFTACSASISSSWTVSQGTTGWARDNSTGFTIQWGSGSIALRGTATVTFPKTFSEVYQMTTASSDYTSSGRSYTVDISVNSLSNTNAVLWNICEDINVGARGYKWIAVGIS